MNDDKELDPLCAPGSAPPAPVPHPTTQEKMDQLEFQTNHLTPEQHAVFERNIKLGGPTMWDPGRTKG